AAIVFRPLPELVGDDVARLARAVARWVAALDHEAFDHAVERGAVVSRLAHPLAAGRFPRTRSACEADEVRDRVGRAIGEELALDRSEAGLDRREDLAAAAQTLERVVQRELAAHGIIGADWSYRGIEGRRVPTLGGAIGEVL